MSDNIARNMLSMSRNNGIINCPRQLHLVGHFYRICIMMHGSMTVKYREIWKWKFSLLIVYRTYKFSWYARLLKNGSTVFSETLVRNYQSTLRKISEERRYYLYRAESLDYVISALHTTMGLGHFLELYGQETRQVLGGKS